jgi:hypothetical protein
MSAGRRALLELGDGAFLLDSDDELEVVTEHNILPQEIIQEHISDDLDEFHEPELNVPEHRRPMIAEAHGNPMNGEA